MRVTRIAINGIKGRTSDIRLDKPNLFLTGPVGSGKTAIIDGIRLCMMMPTEHGSTNLDRLSPSGSWSVAMEFEGSAGGVTRLERSMKRGRAEYKANGVSMNKGEYEKRILAVTTAEAHHTSLDEFVGLSGQKRAELFSSILQSGSENTINDPINLSGFDGLADHAQKWLETQGLGGEPILDQYLSNARAIAGAPGEIATAVNSARQEEYARLKDQKSGLESLYADQPVISHGMSSAEIGEKIRVIDEELGGFAEQLRNAESEKERHIAAGRLVDSQKERVQSVTDSLDKAKEIAADREPMEQAVSRTEAALTAANELLDQRFSDHERMTKEVEKSLDALSAIRNRIDLLEQTKGMFEEMAKNDTQWVFDVAANLIMANAEVDAVEMNTDTDQLLHHVTIFVAAIRDRAMQGHGGDLDTQLETAKSEYEDMLSAAGDARSNHGIQMKICTDLDEQLKQDRNKLEAAINGEKFVEDLTSQLERANEQLLNLQQSQGKLAVSQDLGTIEIQVKEAQVRRSESQTQLAEINKANAVAGQIETAKIQVMEQEKVVEYADVIKEVVSSWRDQIVGQKMSDVMAPFRDHFKKFFGEGSDIKTHIEGKGRSTEFSFDIVRNAIPTPIELLSSGETVLAAAAFLCALQKINGVEGKILTLETDTLDNTLSIVFASQAPGLGMDFIVLANNHMMPTGDATENWCVVDLSKAG